MTYKCGHEHKPTDVDGMTWIERRQFLQWKYTVGMRGSKEQCFDCFIHHVERH